MSTTVQTAVDRRAWAVLGVAAVGVFVVFLDATIVNIAFPAISRDFQPTSRADLSWVINAYAVVVGALVVTGGQLADDRGRKKVFLAGLVTFAVTSVLCGLAPSVGFLIAARTTQALGAAMLVPSSLGLVLPEFPASMRAGVVGLWGAAGAAAAAAGPTLGALLVDGPGWRWVFYLNVPLCAGAWLVGTRVLRDSKARELVDHPDYLGAAMVIATFGSLSLFIVEGSNWGWTSPREIIASILATLFVPSLVKRGRTHPRPALPTLLFRSPAFALANLGTLLFSAAFFATILCNVLFLTGVWHYSLLRTAVSVLPAPVIATLLAPFAGRIADRRGFGAVVVPGALAMVAAQLWFTTRTGVTPHYFHDFFPANCLAGLGVGFAFASLGAAGAQSLPADQFAIGSGVIATSRQLGAVVGVALLVAVVGVPAPQDALHAFQHAWLVNAAMAFGCFLACIALAAYERNQGRR